MTTDLEDRLRTQAQKIADEGYHRWSELCVEVADVLGSQADRIQALEAKCALLAASLAQEEAKCAELERDAERWRTEIALRNDKTVAIFYVGMESRCSIYRSGVLIASGGTYQDAIDDAVGAQAGSKEGV